MAKLALVVLTAFLMYTVASQPLDVNVEVTVNGVKIPIGQQDQPGKLRERAGGIARLCAKWPAMCHQYTKIGKDQPVKLRARAGAAKTLDNSNEIIPDYLIRRGK